MNGTQIGSMVLFFLGISAGLFGLGYSIYKSVVLVKDKRVSFDMTPFIKRICIGIAGFVLFFTLGMSAIYAWNDITPTAAQYLCMMFGGIFFTLSLGLGINAFILHYYGKGFNKALDKTLFYILIASIPLTVITFFIYTNAYTGLLGPYYILPNGLNFTKGFVSPTSGDSPNVAFYAICILAGAVFVYFLCDHYMYREYGKHGTLDTTFFTAFPAGIVGARIAYVIGNWTKDGFDYRVTHGEWWSIFAVWEGGLTILGGAIAGIAVGVLVYIKTNKGRSIWRAIDLIVPTILIAQAIGRWGNFFNCEVHGAMVSEAGWHWLPNIVFNNAHYSSALKAYADSGYLFVPLFFIEFITNLLGYFVIAHLFGIKFKKMLKPGDLGAAYLIWYGYTRIFMEPLRHPSFKMGENDFWSWTWALVFVAVGTLLIAVNHIVRYKKENKEKATLTFGKRNTLIASIVLGATALGLIVSGIITMVSNPFVAELEFTGFNIGIILLASGVAFLFLTCSTIFELVYFSKHQEVVLDA